MKKIAFIWILLLLVCCPSAAKPMPRATVEQGVQKSVYVVEAEYVGYKKEGPITYFGGPVAHYRVVKTLKGKAPKRLRLGYRFHDGSACLAEKGWKFDPKLMPKVGSRWILLVVEGPRTYRGDFGRLPSTPDNLTKVKRLIQ